VIGLEERGDVPVTGLERGTFEEPTVERYGRKRTGDHALLRVAHGADADVQRDLGDGLMIEELLRGQPNADLARAADDLQADQRASAELEEVVVNADFGETEQLAPDGRECLFDLIAMRDDFFRNLWTSLPAVVRTFLRLRA